MAIIRIYCECGKEIFQDMPEQMRKTTTIWFLEQVAQCSNCLMKFVAELPTPRPAPVVEQGELRLPNA